MKPTTPRKSSRERLTMGACLRRARASLYGIPPVSPHPRGQRWRGSEGPEVPLPGAAGWRRRSVVAPRRPDVPDPRSSVNLLASAGMMCLGSRDVARTTCAV